MSKQKFVDVYPDPTFCESSEKVPTMCKWVTIQATCSKHGNKKLDGCGHLPFRRVGRYRKLAECSRLSLKKTGEKNEL